jgi:maleylacetate reductase
MEGDEGPATGGGPRGGGSGPVEGSGAVEGGRRFLHVTRPLRVVFRSGASEDAGHELEALGVERALLVTTPRGAFDRSALASAEGRLVGVFAEARLHVPERVVAAATEQAHRSGADGILAFGGGSAVGVAKGVALETGLPILAIPTTYSGSEMTSIWGVTGADGKRTGRDPAVAPRTVIYDPRLTLSLPPRVSGASGMNALAHAVEALYAPDGSPLATLLAEEAIGALTRALPRISTDPRGLAHREEALYGAHLAAWSLDLASMGLHHKLCHVLGGLFGLPHAELHALLLPHVTAYNAPGAPEAMARVARAMGGDLDANLNRVPGQTPDRGPGRTLHRPMEAPRLLLALHRALQLPRTLRELGLGPGDLDRASEAAVRGGYPNPRAVTQEGVRGLLQGAWEGELPG